MTTITTHLYYFCTDAGSRDITAASPDEAAAKFAASERLTAENMAELEDAITDIDGAWLIVHEDGCPLVDVGRS